MSKFAIEDGNAKLPDSLTRAALVVGKKRVA